MIKIIFFIIFVLFFICGFNSNVLGCTGFTASNDDIVLVGNNEDWRYPDSYIRIYPPSSSSYGRIIFDVNFFT